MLLLTRYQEGEFFHLEREKRLLVLLHLQQKQHSDKEFSEEYIHAFIFLIQKIGMPRDYRFDYKFNGTTKHHFSEDLQVDLEYLHKLSYFTTSDNNIYTLQPNAEKDALVSLSVKISTDTGNKIKEDIEFIKYLTNGWKEIYEKN